MEICCARVAPKQLEAVSTFTEELFDKRSSLDDGNYMRGMAMAKYAHMMVCIDVVSPYDDVLTPRAWRAGRRNAMRCVTELTAMIQNM